MHVSATDLTAPGAVPTDVTEATLRRLFPDAPADLHVPRDVRSLWLARLRDLWAARRTRFVTLLTLGLLAAAASVAVGLHGLAGFVLVVLVAAAVTLLAVQHHRATSDFFVRYAAARGLQLHGRSAPPHAQVPLLRRGDRRHCDRLLVGTIAGQDGTVAHYTYTVVTRDSEGRTSSTDHDFTLVCCTLPPAVAARYAGVYVASHKLSLGRLQDAMSHDRAVHLESADFERRYSLRVVDSQDDIALYELLSTTFVDELATTLEVTWEQVADQLVVYQKGLETEAADLDALVLRASLVLQRYLDEYR